MPITIAVVIAIAVTIAAAELACTVEKHSHIVETSATVDFFHFAYETTLHKSGTHHKQSDISSMGHHRGVGNHINRRQSIKIYV